MGKDAVAQPLHRDIAETIRRVLTDPEVSDRSRELVATFTRKAADHLKADYPAFSCEWFFGACGLDNWGELLPSHEVRR